ncbi:MAG: hypothetical protein H6585_11960 [Flavobacteriales bacterium]|nr:hypothetical protein [Flavobacteriales bacterium]MCB9449045.1 hypothetical protein [Flavobacteriales bacterium]
MADEKYHAPPEVQIEIEKQKTKRFTSMLIFFGILAVVSFVVIFQMVGPKGKGGKGSFNIDIKKGTFSFNVDQPIVEQAKTATKSVEAPSGERFEYTTGSVTRDQIHEFDESGVQFFPDRFTGKNLVNEAAGFVVYADHPNDWHVTYNQAGLDDPLTPINTFMYSDGSHMNVTKEFNTGGMNLEQYVEASIDNLFAAQLITEEPYVSYSDDYNTAFLTFTNQYTNGVSFMKIIKGGNQFLVASANYNFSITPKPVQEDLVNMVSDITLIE